jgi:virginiamycin B lyase
MAIDDRKRVWVADSGPQPNHLLAFDIANDRFLADVDIEHASGAVWHMIFHAPGRVLWFGTDTDYLVRGKVPRARIAFSRCRHADARVCPCRRD